jgi:hypothetical protein
MANPNQRQTASFGQLLRERIENGEQPPQYIRLPRNKTHCPYCGLTRSYLNCLILPTKANGFNPPVRSKCMKHPYAKRGVRLIDFGSLMDYIESQPNGDGSIPERAGKEWPHG